MVTHHVNHARWNADKVVFLDHGRVVESGSPSKVLYAPDAVRVRRFIEAWEYAPDGHCAIDRR
jgi:ABC-type histidine transport system ATPase subunit